jgi:hypothetical protein
MESLDCSEARSWIRVKLNASGSHAERIDQQLPGHEEDPLYQILASDRKRTGGARVEKALLDGL